MALSNGSAQSTPCPRCGARAQVPGRRFCGACGLRLSGESGFAGAFWLIAIAAAIVLFIWRLS